VNTRRTDAIWRQITARLAHPAGQDYDGPRPRLCSIIGSHDGHHGRCVDCGKTLGSGDAICAGRDGVL